MSQFDFGLINALIKTGTELADDFSGPGKWRDALNSLHTGTIDFNSSDIEVLASNIIELPPGHGLTFLVNQTIRTAGFGTGANNGIFKVTAFSGDQLTVDGPLTIEAPGASVTINNLRPAYAQAGTIWLDISLAPIWNVFIYDGADDILIRQIDVNLSLDLNRAVTIYSSLVLYQIDDHIVDVGIIYVSLANDNLNNTPASSPTEWTVQGSLMPASATTKGIKFLPKRIILENSGGDVNNDLFFKAGNFIFDDGSGSAAIPTLLKQINANWATGSNAGGMPATVVKTGTFSTTVEVVNGTGTLFLSEFKIGDILFDISSGTARQVISITSDILMGVDRQFIPDVVSQTVRKNGLALSGTYHCFGLSSVDGTITDAGFDGDVNAANLIADSAVIAAGLTVAGRVGSRIREITKILPMTQFGKISLFDPVILDRVSVAVNVEVQQLTTPLRLRVGHIGGYTLEGMTNSTRTLEIGPTFFTQPLQGSDMVIATNGAFQVLNKTTITDLGSQIQLQQTNVVSPPSLSIDTQGWVDFSLKV